MERHWQVPAGPGLRGTEAQSKDRSSHQPCSTVLRFTSRKGSLALLEVLKSPGHHLGDRTSHMGVVPPGSCYAHMWHHRPGWRRVFNLSRTRSA